MSPILHILHAKPIDIKCVQKRFIGGCWVDVLDQNAINRINRELDILDFFLGDLKKINQYQKPTSSFRSLILELRKRGLIEMKTGNQYITTEAGWEYMCRYKANATQRESAEIGKIRRMKMEYSIEPPFGYEDDEEYFVRDDETDEDFMIRTGHHPDGTRVSNADMEYLLNG